MGRGKEKKKSLSLAVLPKKSKSKAGGVAAEGRHKDTAAQQWRITRLGRFKKTPRAAPPCRAFRHANWVVGGSVERIALLSMTPAPPPHGKPEIGAIACAAVRQPSPHMKRIGCDRCVGPHRPRNTLCAATLGVPTPLHDPDKMYDFETGLPLDTFWEVIEESARPRAVVVERVYRRVA